jgi:hypothetical protein
MASAAIRQTINEIILGLQIAGGKREATTLVVVDQAEELLVRSDENKASAFLSLLRSAMDVPDSPLMAISPCAPIFWAIFSA